MTFSIFQLFLSLALVTTAFVFWRRGRYEHYEEDVLFDGFLWSVLSGFVWARIGFVVLNIDRFGVSVWDWFNLVERPGMSWLVGVMGATLILIRFVQRQRWDVYEVLDYWCTALALGASIITLGWFFQGVRGGTPMLLPAPLNILGDRQPVQLYASLSFLGMFWYLTWVEYRYRMFRWYKARRSSAQTGFVTGAFLILTGLSQLVLLLLMSPQLTPWFGMRWDMVAAAATFLLGAGIIWVRSGRPLLNFK